MKWFPSYFNVSYTLDLEKVEPGKLGVIIVESTPGDKIYEALAMSEKRADEIQVLAKVALLQTDSFTAAIKQVERQCKHPNELVYGVFMLTEARGSNMHPLAAILGGKLG